VTGLALQNVSVRFGRRGPWVLSGVNGILPRGSVTAVTGRNGAGKTTLLRVLAGVLPVSRGEVVGRPAVVGWVPERFPADQAWTVRQYLDTAGRVRGLPLGAAAIAGWAERLFLTSFLDTRLSELSKGTAQKVGLAQALLIPPDLLLLDEPWEGIDVDTRELVPDIIDEVLDDGGAVLVSDHSGDTGHLPGVTEWAVVDGAVEVVKPGKRSEDREAPA
jgi:ABC-type multidrug transport system ATPase subunit